jgi:hypothetical protein
VAAAAATVLSLSPVVGAVRAASRLLRRTAVAVLVDRVVVPRDMFVLGLFFLFSIDRSWLAWRWEARLLGSRRRRKRGLPNFASKHHKLPPFSLFQSEISAQSGKAQGRRIMLPY